MVVASVATISPANSSSDAVVVREIDPTADSRWDTFLKGHQHASVFHTSAWLQALRKTYSYDVLALTTTPPDTPLTNAIPFCRMRNWIGKQRLVSLPFSDHCEPLVESSEQLADLTSYLQTKCQAEGWEYVEVRPVMPAATVGDFEKVQSFCYHRLNLRPSTETIFAKLHKNCVQRKVRRAEKEHLKYEKGLSHRLLRHFYELLILTRRRQGIPIQPMEWFQNLISCFGEDLSIRVALRNGRAVAGILTIRYKKTLVYKYGCSDRDFSRYGGMQLLLWRAIEEAKQEQLVEFDLGRSDIDNYGLIAFKNRWGASPSELGYFRCGSSQSIRISKIYRSPISRYVWSHAPGRVITAAGRLLYGHFG